MKSPFWLRNEHKIRDDINLKIRGLLRAFELQSAVGFPLLFFSLSVVIFFIYTSFLETVVYGFPWSVILGIAVIHNAPIILWQILYFCVMAYNFKLELQLENTRLKLLALTHRKRYLSIILFDIMKNMYEIHRRIIVNNRFWSHFLLGICSALGGGLSIYLAQLFEDIDVFTLIFFIWTQISIVSCITMLLISGVGVHNESNKSYYILTNLMANSNSLNFPLRSKFKVILKLNFSKLGVPIANNSIAFNYIAIALIQKSQVINFSPLNNFTMLKLPLLKV